MSGTVGITIEAKAWDGDFFGFPVGAVDLPEGFAAVDVAGFYELLTSSGFRLVYIQSSVPVVREARDAFAVNGIEFYGGRIVYRKNLERVPARTAGCNVAVDKSPRLEELAWMSGGHSRFMRDGRLRPFFRPMYSTWLSRELDTGKVFVHLDEDVPVGMATVTLETRPSPETLIGNIGLVAVDAANRGGGIASRLLETVCTWLVEAGASECEVVTQTDNLAARSLYEKNGFCKMSETEIWHFWNPVYDRRDT